MGPRIPHKVRWLGRAKKGYEHTDNVKIYEDGINAIL
jgi:hypothetical protein